MTDSRVYRNEGNDALVDAQGALDAGELVVLPTDTVFGLAAHPRVPGATAAVFAAKHRSRELTLPILVPDLGHARRVAVLDERAETLAARFWPGPMTLVLPRTDISRGWDLGQATATVGVRIPHHRVARSLLKRTGPLAVTSANLSGELTPTDCEGLLDQLGDSVAVYLCGGTPPRGVASTVIDLTGPDARAVRVGAVSAADVMSALADG